MHISCLEAIAKRTYNLRYTEYERESSIISRSFSYLLYRGLDLTRQLVKEAPGALWLGASTASVQLEKKAGRRARIVCRSIIRTLPPSPVADAARFLRRVAVRP